MVKGRINTISEKITDGVYRDDAVAVSIEALEPPCLKTYTDPEIIAEKIKETEEAIARDKKTLQAAEKSEELVRQKKKLGTGMGGIG